MTPTADNSTRSRNFIKELINAPPGNRTTYLEAMRIVTLVGMSIHAFNIFLFWMAGVLPLAIINVFSVAIWAYCLVLLRKGKLGAFGIVNSIEVIAHAALCVYYLGWETGFQQPIIASMLMAFVVPRQGYVNAAVSVLCLISYCALYGYSHSGVSFAYGGTFLNNLFIPNTFLGLSTITIGTAYYMNMLKKAEDALEAEHAKSEQLLNNIIPSVIAGRLKKSSDTIAEQFSEASVLFADIEGFTPFSQTISAPHLVQLLNDIFSVFDVLVEKHGVEKIKTIGDAYMVAAGIPISRPDHAEVLANFALDMQSEFARFNKENGLSLRLRIGISSGQVVAGVIGKLRFLYDLWGDCVNTASRMESHDIPGEIQITEETRLLLPNKFILQERGVITVKGKGEMKTYLLKEQRA